MTLDANRWPVTSWLRENWPESSYAKGVDTELEVATDHRKFCIWGVALFVMPDNVRERFFQIFNYADAVYGRQRYWAGASGYITYVNDTQGYDAVMETVATMEALCP